MKTKVICRTTNEDTLAFYVSVNGKEYFLFNQEYKRSIKEHFKSGLDIHAVGNYSSVRSQSVQKILDKLPAYIHYIEKEYDVAIFEKTKKKAEKKNAKAYKRERTFFQDYFAIA